MFFIDPGLSLMICNNLVFYTNLVLDLLLPVSTSHAIYIIVISVLLSAVLGS